MKSNKTKKQYSRKEKIYLVIIVIFVQLLSSIFFLFDALNDIYRYGISFIQIVEAIAAISLFIAIIFEATYVRMMLAEQEKLERSQAILSQEFHMLLEAQYDEWELTASERDIATFTIKGLSIAEIAQMRGSADGTIKAHLNSIYRKSGMSGRHDLLSSLLDHLLINHQTTL